MLESQLAVSDFDESHRRGKPHPGGACRPGIEEADLPIPAEERNVGMSEDYDLRRALPEEGQNLAVKLKPRHCNMYEEQIKLNRHPQSDAEGHGVRPLGACRVDVSPNVDCLADRFQFCNKIEISNISRMENK